MNYRISTTVIKAVAAAIGGGTYGALIQWVLDGITTGSWAMSADAQSVTVTLIVAAATAAHVAIKNVWKNYVVPKIDSKPLGY